MWDVTHVRELQILLWNLALKLIAKSENIQINCLIFWGKKKQMVKTSFGKLGTWELGGRQYSHQKIFLNLL